MAVTTSGLEPDVVTSRLRTSLTGTPGLLRAGLAASLIALLIFALLAADSMSSRRQALRDAKDAAAQTVLIQQVQTSLVEADSLAANAFLVGGIEPSTLRDGYQQGIATASQALATASANASAGELSDLESVNAALVRYTGLIESARANNRQAFPVGVAYLRQASQLLTTEIVPTLEQVSSSTEQRVDAAFERSGSARWGIWIAGLIAIAALVACQLLLAKVTRRTLNLGLLVGTVLLVVAFFWGAISMSSAASTANDARDGSYEMATDVAAARIDAFAAKSNESLALINRGSGASFEEGWQALIDDATAALGRSDDPSLQGVLDDLGAYVEVHGQIRALDDEGQWDDAVALATGFDSGQSNAVFATFAASSASVLGDAATDVERQLADAADPLGATRTVVLVLSLLAAVAVVWGFNLRMKEYR